MDFLLFSLFIFLSHASADVLDLVYIDAPPSLPLFSHAHIYSPEDIVFHKTAGDHFALNITMGGIKEPVILDTGSTFTWICVPFNSPTLTYLDFRDADCHRRVPYPWPSPSNRICHYKINYLQGTASGMAVADTILLHNIQGRVIFGIAEKFHPEPLHARGLLALGTNDQSVVRQLQLKRFGHCMGQRRGKFYLNAAASFDSVQIIALPDTLRFKPNDKHYLLPLSSIGFNGRFIRPPFEENYVILDTGMHYTMLIKPLYDDISKEVKELLVDKYKLKPVCNEQCQPPCTCNSPNCYFSDMDESVRLRLPFLEFHFENTGLLDLHEGIYMVRTPQLHWCLAVRQMNDQANIVGILGNQMLKERMFIYDVENSVISFAKAQCPTS